MKPAPFRYARPRSLDEAVALLASDADAKILAGGQSLVPMMNMRLVRPAVLVDVNALRGLDRIEESKDGGLALGALVRHADLVASPLVQARAPLLAEAARHVGHAAIRNRGTLGGSVAHADPAAELPAALVALGAEIEMTGPSGARRVAAAEFFHGMLATALGQGEMLVAVHVPVQTPGWGFAELARRPGDFALAGVAATVRADASGTRCAGASLVGFGLGDRPMRLAGAEGRLDAAPLDDDVASRVADAAGADCDPPDDVHGSAEYRRHLAGVLAERAIADAVARLRGAA